MTDINALAVVDKQQIDNLTIQEVKNLWCPLITDKEFGLFVGICKSFGLNPFKREIYCIKYSASAPASIVVGYEVYLKRADRTGKLDGWNVVIVDAGTDNERAVITIYRKDFKNPFIWECYKKEVAKQQANWKSMPIFMLKKVAIGQGFRLAFPDEMGGMPYVQEELVQEEHTTKTFTPHQTVTATEVKQDKMTEPVSNDMQIKFINELVAETKDPVASSKWICDHYKVDSYGQLSFREAGEVIEQLEKSTKKEVVEEKSEPVDDQRPETKPEPKGAKPISEKQLSAINKMGKHYHEKWAGKLSVLLVKEGAESLEKCTSYQASNIMKKLIEQIEKDKKEKEADAVNHP